MFPKPAPQLAPNTYAYESQPMVKPTGFREYDARWLLRQGNQPDGRAGARHGHRHADHEMGVKPEIVTGHDFRGYSASIKMALTSGLMAAGMRVRDIGLAHVADGLFRAVRARRALCRDGDGLAQRQWLDRRQDGRAPPADLRPRRDGAAEGDRAEPAISTRGGGSYQFVDRISRMRYIADLTEPPEDRAQAARRRGLRQRHGRRLRAGDAGALGCEVIPLDCRTRPHVPALQPEPRRHEDAACDARCGDQTGADVGSASTATATAAASSTTGRRDFRRQDRRDARARPRRCIRARSSSSTSSRPVCSQTDPVLIANGATTDYWKTGHSYIKRRVNETGALAGFEKSGHFFFNPPIGRGYDDGLVSAIAVCDMLDRNPASRWPTLRRCRRPGVADDVAALRRRGEVRRRRAWWRISRRMKRGRQGRRPADPPTS
jgi:phosphomannomutase/phosphoglucomutase